MQMEIPDNLVPVVKDYLTRRETGGRMMLCLFVELPHIEGSKKSQAVFSFERNEWIILEEEEEKCQSESSETSTESLTNTRRL